MISTNFAKFLLFAILIPPRIELISIAGSSIRLTDFLFIFVILWYATNLKKMKTLLFPYRSVLKMFMLIAISSFMSTFLSVGLGRLDSLTGALYFLRPVQYLFLLPLALVLSFGQQIFIQRMIFTFTTLNFLVVVLQVNFGLQIGSDRFGFSRSSGLLGGPYELGIASVFLLIFWYDKRSPILFLMSGYMFLSSASRANAIAVIVILLYMLFSKKKIKKVKFKQDVNFIAIAIFVLLVALVSPFSSEIGRFGIAFSERFENTQDEMPALASISKGLGVEGILKADDYYLAAFSGVPNLSYQSESVDISTSRRLYIWALVISTVNQNGMWLFGMGAGFYSSAVDGNWTRIYGEVGLFGVILWIVLFRRVYKMLNYMGRLFLFAWIVNGLFIDIFTSLVPNVLFFIALTNFVEKKSLYLESSNQEEKKSV